MTKATLKPIGHGKYELVRLADGGSLGQGYKAECYQMASRLGLLLMYRVYFRGQPRWVTIPD